MSSSQVSDMAAIRKALEAIRNLAYEVQDMNREGDVKTSMPTAWVIDIVGAALSAPARNCDVGTADEQLPRFVAAWESAHRCVVDRRSKIMLSVFSRWAQLPYEAEHKGEGEGAGDD